MWVYVCCAWLGSIIGIGVLLFFQGANRNICNHEKIMKDSEDEK